MTAGHRLDDIERFSAPDLAHGIIESAEVMKGSPADGRTVGNAFDTIVAGPLCESGDVFTQEEGGVVTTRKLPEAVVGDYLILHDAGAYGAAMSSNYNTRKLAPEILIQENQADVIRERQTFDAILQFERVPKNLV